MKEIKNKIRNSIIGKMNKKKKKIFFVLLAATCLTLSMTLPILLIKPESTNLFTIGIQTFLADTGKIDENTMYFHYTSIAFTIDKITIGLNGHFNFTIPIVYFNVTNPLRLAVAEEDKIITKVEELQHYTYSSIFKGLRGAVTRGWVYFQLYFVYSSNLSEYGLDEYQENFNITRFDIESIEREYESLCITTLRETALAFTYPVFNYHYVWFNTTWDIFYTTKGAKHY